MTPDRPPPRQPLPQFCAWCGSAEVMFVDSRWRGRCAACDRKHDAVAVERIPVKAGPVATQGRLF